MGRTVYVEQPVRWVKLAFNSDKFLEVTLLVFNIHILPSAGFLISSFHD
jgi:hypothetical protein